jgi:hypothetical protein
MASSSVWSSSLILFVPAADYLPAPPALCEAAHVNRAPGLVGIVTVLRV